jgi:hypothetical protein
LDLVDRRLVVEDPLGVGLVGLPQKCHAVGTGGQEVIAAGREAHIENCLCVTSIQSQTYLQPQTPQSNSLIRTASNGVVLILADPNRCDFFAMPHKFMYELYFSCSIIGRRTVFLFLLFFFLIFFLFLLLLFIGNGQHWQGIIVIFPPPHLQGLFIADQLSFANGDSVPLILQIQNVSFSLLIGSEMLKLLDSHDKSRFIEKIFSFWLWVVLHQMRFLLL